MPLTTYGKQRLLDAWLRQQPLTEDLYLALGSSAAITWSGEVATASYQRLIVPFNAAGAGGSINTSDREWVTAGENWGTISYLLLGDSPTKGSGNLWAYETFVPITVLLGEQVAIRAGKLTINMT